jgi:hypothetical protein
VKNVWITASPEGHPHKDDCLRERTVAFDRSLDLTGSPQVGENPMSVFKLGRAGLSVLQRL